MTKNNSMETLFDKFKPIALEKYEIGYRQTKKTNWIFRMFSLSTFQSKGHNQRLFHLKNTIKDCSIENTFKTTSPSIQTLIEELKSVVLQKDELEHRDISILTAFLPIVVNEDSKSDLTEKSMSFKNDLSVSSRTLWIDTLMDK